MKKNEIEQEDFVEVEIDLEKIKTLIKCMENGLIDEFNYNRADILNLLSITSKLVGNIEQILFKVS